MAEGPRVFLDANVLFPPLTRGLFLQLATTQLFQPYWSERVLDEWQLATARQRGPGAEAEVPAVRAAMAEVFPGACLPAAPAIELALDLPDPSDNHVAAAAHDCDVLVTFNLRDFPARRLQALAVQVRHPDEFLWELWSANSLAVETAVRQVLEENGIQWDRRRAVLKRARLSRFGKAVSGRAAPG